MIYLSVEDFFEKAGKYSRLPRDEEKLCAIKKNSGDENAREELINSYLPFVSALIKRQPKENQRLHTVYACIKVLDKAVDEFNFLQDHETFTHHLSIRLKNCLINCYVDRP